MNSELVLMMDLVEYFTRADDTALDLNGQSILAYGKPLERFGNLEGWSAVGSLNKAFSIEDRGDTILLKLTSPSSGKVLRFLISKRSTHWT